jgi:hypothetical protein
MSAKQFWVLAIGLLLAWLVMGLFGRWVIDSRIEAINEPAILQLQSEDIKLPSDAGIKVKVVSVKTKFVRKTKGWGLSSKTHANKNYVVKQVCVKILITPKKGNMNDAN